MEPAVAQGSSSATYINPNWHYKISNTSSGGCSLNRIKLSSKDYCRHRTNLHQAILRAYYQVMVWNQTLCCHRLVIISKDGYWRIISGCPYWQLFPQLQRVLFTGSSADMWKNAARLKDASAKKQGFFVQTCATAEVESECENHHNDDECVEDEGYEEPEWTFL